MPHNPHADFVPTLKGYSGQGAFRFWCQLALPLTFDDSLSYYELLNKVVVYLNNTIEDVKNVEDNVQALNDAFENLQNYVNTYFDEIDIEAELRNVLDAMAEDGSLDSLLDPLVAARLGDVVASQINEVVASQIDAVVAEQVEAQLPDVAESLVPDVVTDWLDEHITYPDPGEAVIVDDSLTVSGAAADAKVTGDYINNLNIRNTFPTVRYAPGFLSTNGDDNTRNLYCVVSDFIPVQTGDRIINRSKSKDPLNVNYIRYYGFYDKNKHWIGRYGLSQYLDYTVTDQVGYIRFMFGHDASTGKVWDDSYYEDISIEFIVKPSSYEFGKSLETNMLQNSKEEIPDMFVYTDISHIEGIWTEYGTISNRNDAYELIENTHTNLMKIIPGHKCYLSNILEDRDEEEVISATYGAYFDQFLNYIGPLRRSDVVESFYKEPQYESDPNHHTFTYAKIYEFTAPSNAYYVSLNESTNPDIRYKDGLSSCQVLTKSSSGDIVVKNSPAYNFTKNRKICVIGASLTALDRAWKGELNQYLINWQEYVFPFYKEGITYGFSGGAMCNTEWISGGGAYLSVYDGICNVVRPDLSGYDDFIIFATKNDMQKNAYQVGTWGTIEDTEFDTHTYMGGLRSIVAYILAQNNKARIFLTTFHHYGNYFNPNVQATMRARENDVNEETREFSEFYGLNLIDLCKLMGFNKNNYSAGNYTYDGSHFNQVGAELAGHVIRKVIIGI